MKYYKVSLTDVVEVSPGCLKIKNVDCRPSGIELYNFVNGGYFWHHADGKTFPLGILVSEGKVISDRQPHNKPTGTLIVYNDDTVAVKELLTIKNEKNVWFAISGCSILPKINMVSAGFTGAYADIGRVASRPMIGYRSKDKKIIIAVRPQTNIGRGQLTLKNLGCDFGITLDGGGSTALRVRGNMLHKTTRRINHVITW